MYPSCVLPSPSRQLLHSAPARSLTQPLSRPAPSPGINSSRSHSDRGYRAWSRPVPLLCFPHFTAQIGSRPCLYCLSEVESVFKARQYGCQAYDLTPKATPSYDNPHSKKQRSLRLPLLLQHTVPRALVTVMAGPWPLRHSTFLLALNGLPCPHPCQPLMWALLTSSRRAPTRDEGTVLTTH